MVIITGVHTMMGRISFAEYKSRILRTAFVGGPGRPRLDLFHQLGGSAGARPTGLFCDSVYQRSHDHQRHRTQRRHRLGCRLRCDRRQRDAHLVGHPLGAHALCRPGAGRGPGHLGPSR